MYVYTVSGPGQLHRSFVWDTAFSSHLIPPCSSSARLRNKVFTSDIQMREMKKYVGRGGGRGRGAGAGGAARRCAGTGGTKLVVCLRQPAAPRSSPYAI